MSAFDLWAILNSGTPAEQVVAETEQGEIVGAQLVDLVPRLCYALVPWPVEDRPAIIGGEHFLESLGSEERFVRIDGLDL